MKAIRITIASAILLLFAGQGLALDFTDPLSGAGSNISTTFMQYRSNSAISVNNLHSGVDVTCTSGAFVYSGLVSDSATYLPDSTNGIIVIADAALGSATDMGVYYHTTPIGSGTLQPGATVTGADQVGTVSSSHIHPNFAKAS